MSFSSSRIALKGLSLALAAGLSLFASLPVAGKTLRVGVTNTPADAGIFIADKKGFFRQEGLDVTLMSMTIPADMIEALRTGAIDIGGSIVSPLLFNVAANARMKVVADRGSPGQPNNHFSLLVRADHMVAGRFQTLGDLRGMRIAIPPMSVNNSSSRLMAILQEAGLDWDDVRPVEVNMSAFSTGLKSMQPSAPSRCRVSSYSGGRRVVLPRRTGSIPISRSGCCSILHR